jgi:reelin
MQIGASYSLQFSLVMGCGRQPSPHIDTQVRLEFSTNHGLTWHLVKEVRKHNPFISLAPSLTVVR